jgi:hypothetical protein
MIHFTDREIVQFCADFVWLQCTAHNSFYRALSCNSFYITNFTYAMLAANKPSRDAAAISFAKVADGTLGSEQSCQAISGRSKHVITLL